MRTQSSLEHVGERRLTGYPWDGLWRERIKEKKTKGVFLRK